jgi:hypothetical protein
VSKKPQKEKKKSKKRKCNKIDSDDEDDDADYVAPENTGIFNVFSDSYISKFELWCKQYGKNLQHQSDRTLPRTHYNSTKYTNLAKKSGHEMAGLLLVYLTVFMTGMY